MSEETPPYLVARTGIEPVRHFPQTEQIPASTQDLIAGIEETSAVSPEFRPQSSPKRLKLTRSEGRALGMVLEYLHDELKDFEQSSQPLNHIGHQILLLGRLFD